MTRVPRSLLLAAGGVVVVGVVGLGATTAFAGDSVARGVHVADVDLSGADRHARQQQHTGRRGQGFSPADQSRNAR